MSGQEPCQAPSASRYQNKGCRCEGCKQAESDYRRRRKAAAPRPRDNRLPAEELAYLRRLVGFDPTAPRDVRP